MQLIVGLGNPGAKYVGTRHNMGFLVVDAVARRVGIAVERKRFDSLLGKGDISGVPVILVKPQTFMNLSGNAVAQVARYFGLGAEEIVIVHDDMDFPTGEVRIRMRGGAGGHKGLLSIIDHLGRPDFARVRVGVGRPSAGVMVERHVLDRFPKSEARMVDHAVERACDAVIEVVSSGVQAAMNKCNARTTQKLSEEV